MAAKGPLLSQHRNVESVVNRWLVDYYLSLALELFEKRQYADFLGVRDVLDCVLVRPVVLTDGMRKKILLLQFLTLIHKGERLDVPFDPDPSKTPLESALTCLEEMRQECHIPQKDFENICTSVKEMIVGVFIQNSEFDKAEEMLSKHFPKSMVGKKAMLMGLINKKRKMNEDLEQMNFQDFRDEMFTFCQKLCPHTCPFLHKAAKQLIDETVLEEDGKAAGTVEEVESSSEQDGPSPLTSPTVNSVKIVQQQSVIQRTRLEAAYNALAAGSVEMTFAQLKDEVETDEQETEEQERDNFCLQLSLDTYSCTHQKSEEEGPFQRNSGSPMEASPAERPQTDAVTQTQVGSLSKMAAVTRNRQLPTLAQLVVEPDSQAASQCTTSSHEAQTEVEMEKSPQTCAVSDKNDQQCPLTVKKVSVPTRKRRRVTRTGSRFPDRLVERNNDDSPDSVANSQDCSGELLNLSNSSLSSLCRNSKSRQSSSDVEGDSLERLASCESPVQKSHQPPASDSQSEDPDNTDDTSPGLADVLTVTPGKHSAQSIHPSQTKWKKMYNNAKESKDTWSDEESYFPSKRSSGLNASTLSDSSHKKRKWTESETLKLKEGVKKFGEGNWSKIKSHYSFKDRTNVNLKDRWRTLKKLNMV
ncbi:telomeric repeat binding factor a isoform X2 [Mugil cephalus]|uniref:telomeric repeat binding factor a isoform X2 n=1 Tax=Mugil cephalus TaxID=48193 RepID=UPI001FB6FCA5|nr:telomeric repeat binding factor a isoform X2 [Mugil cephalus]